MTLLGVGVAALAIQSLPALLSRLAENEEFQEAFSELGGGPGAALAGISFSDADDDPLPEPDAGSIAAAPSRSDPVPPVEISDQCPPGARERSGAQEGGRAWWCETEVDGRWVRHGPARTWHDNGYLESEGVYDHGRRSGTWTRYWRSGGRRVQAEFRDGVQHGWMHRWDAFGELERAVRYADGDVADL